MKVLYPMLLWAVMISPATISPAQGAEKSVPVTESPPLTVEQILAETLTDEDYDNSKRCLSLRSVSDTKILDRQHISFRATRDKYFIVRLIRPCQGLDRDDLLVLNGRDSRLCRLDRINAIDRVSQIPSARCVVDSVSAVTGSQYKFLRKELRNNR